MTEVPEVTAKSILPGAVPQPTDLGVPIPTPWGQLNVPQEIYDHYLSLIASGQSMARTSRLIWASHCR